MSKRKPDMTDGRCGLCEGSGCVRYRRDTIERTCPRCKGNGRAKRGTTARAVRNKAR